MSSASLNILYGHGHAYNHAEMSNELKRLLVFHIRIRALCTTNYTVLQASAPVLLLLMHRKTFLQSNAFQSCALMESRVSLTKVLNKKI